MQETSVLTKEELIEFDAKHDVARCYILGNYKVILFEDGFLFLLGHSMFSDRIHGKSKEDLTRILNKLKQ